MERKKLQREIISKIADPIILIKEISVHAQYGIILK